MHFVSGFQHSFTPSKSVTNLEPEDVGGDGLLSCLILPLDFSWEKLSEAYRILGDYRKLPNIERWFSLETNVIKKCDVSRENEDVAPE